MLKEYRALLPYLRAHRMQYLTGLFFLIITDASQLYLPQLIRRAIDTVAMGDFELRVILGEAARMLLAALVIAAGRFFWRISISGASRQIERELRGDLFRHLQTLSSTFYGKKKTGDLMAHMTNDINAIRMATGSGFALAVDGLIMVISVLTIMIGLESNMALVSLSPLPILTISVLFFSRIVGRQFTKVQEGFSKISDTVQEAFSGVRVLKTFVKESVFSGKFAEVNQIYSRRNLELVRSWGFFFPAVALLAGITNIIFLLLGGGAVIEGSMSPGEFTAFFSYLQMLIWPLLGAGFTVNMIQRAGASLKRINVIMNEDPDIKSPADAADPTNEPRTATSTTTTNHMPLESASPIRGELIVRKLAYTYPGGESPVLSGVDITVPEGSSLGILGRTGAGKSTLVNLIPRILDPPPNTVFVDGKDIRTYPLAEIRGAISMVPQDTFLFSTSIKENIRFGNRDAADHELRETATVSTIERDFAVFPDDWETVVGERGVTLSGGQKQRVAISRALASPASILIFDDALSSVDTETEDAILTALAPYLRGRTFIVVSHRISTLKNTDQIVVMDEGVVVQQGSHKELLAQTGFYSEIFRLQQLEESIRKEG